MATRKLHITHHDSPRNVQSPENHARLSKVRNEQHALPIRIAALKEPPSTQRGWIVGPVSLSMHLHES
jgi:hypothetical protein